ncbi:MAG: hypothetical protein P4L64_11380 [Caulobacteraceae bacterium]|nr:hypothetical protein [Caulobacteraceae bacterium]
MPNPKSPLAKKLIGGNIPAPRLMKRKYEKIEPTTIPITIPFSAQCNFSFDEPIAKPITALFNSTHARVIAENFIMPA